MNVSTVFPLLLSLLGSVRVAESGPSPELLLTVLVAFLIAGAGTPVRTTLSYVIVTTAWSAISGGSITIGILCLFFITGAALSRPVRERGYLDTALYISGAILVILAVWAYITRSGETYWLVLLTVAAGWIFSTRFARMNPGPAPFRRSLLPSIAVAVFMILASFVSSPGSGTDRMSRGDGNPGTGDPKEPVEQIAELQRSIYADPWAPSKWYALGREYLRRGNLRSADRSFRNGWRTRPRASNICLHGILATAEKLDRWRDVTQLLLDGYIPPLWIPAAGCVPVGSELWRMGRQRMARDLLKRCGGLHVLPREMTGWILMDMGEKTRALDILRPLAERMSSGETVFRAAELMKEAGHERTVDSLMIRGSRHFPRHLKLGESIGDSPGDSTLQRAGSRADGLELGNTARLLGWAADPDTIRPGESFTVITEWIAEKPLPGMVMILHIDYGVPARWRHNADHIPCTGGCPTVTWPVGEVIRDSATVRLPDDAPRGQLMLYTGLWIPGDPDSRLLPRDSSDYLLPRGEQRIPLGTVQSVADG